MNRKIISYLEVVMGSTLTAAAFGLFILPLGFAAGGTSGLAVVLHTWIPLPVSLLVFLINGILFLLGWTFLGKEFVLKTVVSCVYFPVALEFFQRISLHTQVLTMPLAGAVFSGLLLGTGCILILHGNGSGGGFDILGMILYRKKGVPIQLVMYLADFLIIMFQAAGVPVIYTIYGILVIAVSTWTIGQGMRIGNALEV